MASQDTNFDRAAPKAHRKLPSELNILLVLVGIALTFEILAGSSKDKHSLGTLAV